MATFYSRGDTVTKTHSTSFLLDLSRPQDRVKQTAQAFCESLLEVDVGALPADTLHESSALDDILDGVEAAKEKVEKAKAKIQQVRKSDSSWL